jgi:DNA-binding response OmpR family regulator
VIIFISAKALKEDRIKGLKIGADIARNTAQLRTQERAGAQKDTQTKGD